MPLPSQCNPPTVMTLNNILAHSTTSPGLMLMAQQLIHYLSFSSILQFFSPSLGIIVTLVLILAVYYVRSPWRRVPPGPKGLPVLGNALQLKDKGWMFGKDCKQKFGESNSTLVNIVTPYSLEKP